MTMEIKDKRYTSVSAMVRDLFDASFADDFDRRAAEREVVTALQIRRAVLGLSQREIAQKLGCTQGRISKLESAKDADLRLGDLVDYASALGFHLGVVLTAKDATVVDRVKFHAGSIKRLLDRLAGSALVDSKIAAAISKFFGEVTFNLFGTLQDSVNAQAQTTRSSPPAIEVEWCGIQEKEGMDVSNADASHVDAKHESHAVPAA